jgi:AcrR family transcriptional regulator
MTPSGGQIRERRLQPLRDGSVIADAAPLASLRSDAARNLAKILEAARSTFYEEGIDASVETIAQRAGVGMGTLYRRFPTKESLIEAVVDELLQEVLAVATEALENLPPDIAFSEFLGTVGQLQADHSGCLARLWSAVRKSAVRADIETVARQLLQRAQRAGSVRRDVVYEDVVLLQWSVRGVIESSAPAAPDAWKRHLELMLAALAPSRTPLRHPPLTPAQVQAAAAPRSS